jgi:DNA repair protein RecO (recombination protein O)
MNANAPRVYKTEVVVLRQRKLGEADKILTLLSADLGKFDAVAKGVRRPGSRKAGHIEVLTHARLLVARGRNLDVVTQAETLETYLPLREDVRRLAAGLYVAELVDRFTAEQIESYPIFRLLVDTLGRLSSADDLDLPLRFFEINLLGSAGYQPELRLCVVCQAPLRAVANTFSPVAGGVVCPACTPAQPGLRPMSLNALKVLRLLQRGAYGEAARLKLDHDLGVELEGLLRGCLRVYSERDLNSLRFLHEVRRDITPARRTTSVVS